MGRKTFNIATEAEAAKLHGQIVAEFVNEAAIQLVAGGYFVYATEISSERNGWQTSISYGDKRYVAIGENVSNALYEELVMPCDWLALRWKQEFGMRHKPIHESKSSCRVRVDISGTGEIYKKMFLEKNKQLLQECEQMCQERRGVSTGVVKTGVFI